GADIGVVPGSWISRWRIRWRRVGSDGSIGIGSSRRTMGRRLLRSKQTGGVTLDTCASWVAFGSTSNLRTRLRPFQLNTARSLCCGAAHARARAPHAPSRERGRLAFENALLL